MQLQSIRKLAILAGMAVIASLSTASYARAAIAFTYTDVTTGANAGSASGSATNILSATDQSGGIQVTLSSVPTQNASISTLNTTTITISNTGTGTNTVKISIAAQGFTLPSPTALLTDASSGTSSFYTSGQKAILQSYAAAGSAGLTTIFSGTTPGPQTGTVTGPGNVSTPYVFSPSSGSVSFSSTGGFSIGQMLTITLDAGKTASLTLVTNVSAPVTTPEPATMAMAMAGLPLLGLGALIRRRRARA